MSYAKASKALGQCDRCGFTYKLSLLKYQIEDSKRNGLRVCPTCLDEDQPQLKLGQVNTSDPQSLYNPRVDTGKKSSTSYSAFDPIGGGVTAFGSSTMGLNIKGEIGKLTVSTE
jgi:hypothetical protein|tara:strand:- start:1442 stop:1783 length:342 start_codon:yes stop_codon:yes gene_type:complete